MGTSSESKKTQLAALLVKLYRDHMTGTVTVKDDRMSLRIYLREGHVISADGMEPESRFLTEIARKKGLSPYEMEYFENIFKNNPQALGSILLDKGIISKKLWDRFLLVKVRQILSRAIRMTNAEMGFSETPLDIPPSNRIDYNIYSLVLETIKGINDQDLFQSHVGGRDAVYDISSEAQDIRKRVPLSPSEENLLSLIDGRRSVRDLQTKTSMGDDELYKALYLFLSFAMIEPAKTIGAGEADFEEMVHIYLDLLKIIEVNFRKEVGRQFDRIFSDCLKELGSKSAALFGQLDVSRDVQEETVLEITARFREEGGEGEGGLFLKTSFNKLVFLLIMRMKKIMGVNMTRKALFEMKNILNYVEKYRQETELMAYVKQNLEDYLRQLEG